ncbi:murein biosynthesis integral membrane protein MurJ [Actinomadura sp. 6K520]|uniref:murein biosynthesis integral membrane protein MurJ n=1 Tax=Actinomadura sp. 6K520 TaxID=2530364 RepID=UPI001FB805BC|nr:murein biosynthesis integral membrane protein MurJ [Actinomadura sp. 6K520]
MAGGYTGRVVMPGDVLDAIERREPPSRPERGLEVRHDPSDFGDLGTADRPGEEGEEIGGAAHAAPPSLARSSVIMAIGTVASRATGFIRTAAIVAALGTGLLGDAYQTANMVPFVVYDLLIGGLLASVFVPFLVKRREQDPDGGVATEQRFMTVTLLALAAITFVAVLGAQFLITVYAGGWTGNQRDVAVTLARFLLLQIFFIGASGVVSSMLNSRERFGAPMWAPVVNNLTIIATAVLFLWIAGPGRTPGDITDGQVALLGLGATAGQLLQALILAWSLWRAGFRWRPRLGLRGSGFGEAMRNAGWMMVYAVVAQISLLVSTNVATRAGARVAEAGLETGAGITAYKNAFVIFQLPYAIIAVSVITALLPKMSRHVADGRKDLVRLDFSRGVRLAAVLLVPASVAMVVFAVPMSVVLYARGSASVDDAHVIGYVLMMFAVSLIPFTLFQMMLRVFYSLGDTRTPGLIALAPVAIHGISGFLVLYLAPPEHIVIYLPIGHGLYYVVGFLIAGQILRKRLHGLDGRRVFRSLLLLHLAALPGAAAGGAVAWLLGGFTGGTAAALLALFAGCAVGGVIFGLTAYALRIEEVRVFLETARTKALRR